MQEISIRVFEEGEAVSLHFVGLSFKFNPLLLKMLIRDIEVVDRKRDVAKPRCAHP